MSEMLSEWSFVIFTVWLRSMYSLICFLQSSGNSGFFANLFSNIETVSMQEFDY